MALEDLLNRMKQEQDQSFSLSASAEQSYKVNPEQQAGNVKLAKRSGLPVHVFPEMSDDAKLQVLVDQMHRISETSPATARFLTDPENAKVAHDDIDALTNLERVAREGFGRQGGPTMGIASPNDQKAAKRAKSIGGAFVEGLVSSPENVNEGLARTGQMIAEFVDWSLAAFPDETGLRKRVSGIAKESADYWKQQAEMKAPKKKAGTAESYVQQASSSIGTSLLAAPFGMAGEGPALAMFGMFSEGGYEEMRKAGVPVPMAGALASSNKAMEGLTEKLGLDQIYKGTGPIIKKALGFILGDLAGEEINTAYNALVDKVTVSPDMTMADVVQRVIDTAIVTAIAGPAQGVTMSGAARVSEGLFDNMQARQQAKAQADFLTALGEGVTATKVFSRLPEKVQELVRAAKEDGPVSDVYIPVDRFTELFQSQGMDPRQMAEQILSDPTRYYEAAATGGDVAIPLEEFATLAGESFYQELVKDARTSIGGMTAREAESFGDNAEATINDLLARATEDEAPANEAAYQTAYQKIYDDTYGQLIGIGRAPQQAEADATIRAKGLATLAQRYGYDADMLLQQFPMTISRGELPAVLQRQATFTEQQQQAQLFAMLDSIRSGKDVKPSEIFGPSLVEFLREKGIKDDRGDLKSMDVDSGIKFKKKLLRKDGLSIDKAREAAVEAGYLPEGSDVNALLDAVDSELRGQAKYAPGNLNEKAMEQKQSLDELAQWLDMMGVDLQATDNEQIVEMLQRSTTLNQSAWHGSPHIFDKFSLSAIGTGEGAQAYGYGLYFAGAKEVAEYYRDALSGPQTIYEVDGKELFRGKPEDSPYQMAVYDIAVNGYDDAVATGKAWEEQGLDPQWVKNFNLAVKELKGRVTSVQEKKGRLYKVELAPAEDEYLLWDKPLSEQSEKVKAALAIDNPGWFSEGWHQGTKIVTDPETIARLEVARPSEREAQGIEKSIPAETITGQQAYFYANPKSESRNDKAASEYLHSLGIRGIKYLDGTSRGGRPAYRGDKAYIAAAKSFKNDGQSSEEAFSGLKEAYKDASAGDLQAAVDEVYDITRQNYNYVIFNDEDVEIREMFQRKDVKRGYIRFGEGIPGFDVGLLKDADASTFIHETGHYYLEVLGRLAGQEGAPDGLQKDYQTILSWLGATDKQSLTVDQQEQFARGFEAYLYEGKAPSQELRGVFQRFKVWLKAVYSSLKALNVELTDDVRGVFDRLMATDEEIMAAEREQQVKPIFATAEEAGMSPAVFEAYRKLAEQAHQEASDRLERQKLQEVRRIHEQWYKDEWKAMAEEVEAEAKEDPVYEAVNFLYTGKLFDGSTFEGQDFKLSKSELMKMYDEPTIRAIQKKLGWVYRKEGGISPALVAEMFGFSSADEMVKRIMEAPKLREYVKAETDRRMVEKYGELNTAEIAEEAINAVHNEGQAKLLREELKAINRKAREVRPIVNAAVGEAVKQERADREYERRWMEAERKLAVAIERGAKQAEIDDLKATIKAEKAAARKARKTAMDSIPPVEFFKEAARRAISGKPVMDIMPGMYSRAEAKAGKEAFTLAGKGKYEEAARAKERQLLNHYLYREAMAAREDADKIAKYMRKLDKPEAQGRIGKAGQDYLEQINALLERYEFRNVTNRELGERERLLNWLDRKEAETGIRPSIPPTILEEAEEVNYRTVTIQDLRDLYDTVRAINHLARLEGKLLRNQEKQDIIALAEDAAASIEENSKGLKPRKPEKNLPQDRPGKMMENYFASHRKMSSLARQMDGGMDGGAMWNLIIRPLNEAGDREAVMRAEAAEKLNEVFSVYSPMERTRMHVREFVPQINTSISKWGRIVVALNLGNEGNRQRLSAMYTPEEVAAIVDTLDERDWRFVQNVWDAIDEYWPMIEAKEKRVYGIAPEKVIATPVITKFGTLNGGYYPIKYDREEEAKTGAQEEEEIYKQMVGGAFTRATTRRGHTEARLEAVNRPLSLSIDGLFQHLNQVIHDLTHHEMLVDVNKLLGTSQIQEAIRDHYGMEAYRVFTDGIRDVAVGDIPAQDAFEKFMAYTRVGVSTAGLGYNLVTSMLQPMGLTQSIVRIGPRWVGKGIGRWISTPKRMVETAEWVYDKSPFMAMRGKTQNREIAEIRNQLTVGVIPHSVRDSFFYFIQQMQKTVDIPTWLGQYEKSMAEHGNEADAIAEADQAVIDSQASGMTKDLARIQRGGPMKKLFTTFYSFFSTTYNLAAEAKGRTNFKNPSEVGRFMVDMLLLYAVPAALSTLLKEGVQRAIGGGDDDDELLKKLAAEQLGYVMAGFIGIRELSSLLSGFQGYEGPAGARIYSETAKLIKELEQGEWDTGLFKRLNGLGGILLHYPSTQVQRTVDGMIEVSEGGNLLSLLFGKPKK